MIPLNKKQQKQFDFVCDRIADRMSLRNACDHREAASVTTIIRWLAEDKGAEKPLRTQYAQARETQADLLAEEIVEIADNARNDWMARHGEDDEGYQFNGEHVQRSKLRVDARKWVASKLKPKVYGDKQEVAHTGKVSIVYSAEDAKA